MLIRTWGTTIFAACIFACIGPNDAFACGGFFCNTAQPVNQAAERIVFARDADGTVTAIIEVRYQGPSTSFAWMLPVAGSPTVSVSSTSALDALQLATDPQYTLTTTLEGSCKSESVGFGCGAAASASGAYAPPEAGGSTRVHVAEQGSVGPYDYVVLSVDATAPNAVQTAVDWLHANAYDVDDFGAARLGPYLEAGMNLLAFKLHKGNDAGQIRPVVISFGAGLPSIPIRPTAVAAQNDMGVLVWVLGPSRALPINYMSLELDEALIDWFQPSTNYDAIVTRAANEAGGQGFVTELAGPSAGFVDMAVSEDALTQATELERESWVGRGMELLVATASLFPRADGLHEVIADHTAVPEGSIDPFLACPSCGIDSSVGLPEFDTGAYLAAFETSVVAPLRQTRALLASAPYMTRFYTTMSPDEMTRDPVFDFGAGLADVSNVHAAGRVVECSGRVTAFQAPWRIELAGGNTVRGIGSSWPFDVTDGALPANQRVVHLEVDGTTTVMTDNGDAIHRMLSAHNAMVPGPSSGGCTIGSDVGPGMLSSLVLLMAFSAIAWRRGARR